MTKQNQIKDKTISLLGTYNYENLFNIYVDDDSLYFYNLLKNLHFPQSISPELFTTIVPRSGELLPQLSFRAYNVVNLWWLIAGVNGIMNPLEPLSADNELKIVTAGVVRDILNRIKEG